MKRHLITIKTLALLFCAVLISIVAVQCKKEGQNASSINRAMALSNVDSTIFSPFYDTTVLNIATVKATNDSIITTGIQSIIKANCGNCHNNNIKPNLVTFNDIKSLVTPGNPEGSKLWEVINTNDLNKAMPPVTTAKIVSTEEKIAIYNWIKNGANETPALVDYRATAVRLITGGCTAQCHNQNVNMGRWARTYFDFGRPLTTKDTITGMSHGSLNSVAINDTMTALMWNAYKDSVSRYYSIAALKDTVKKAVSSPMDPLNTYNDIIFNISYPLAFRATTTSTAVAPNKDLFTAANSLSNNLLAKVDSTLYFKNVAKGTNSGNMAYKDGHMTSSEIAIIKAWYFADPNIPDLWKYGNGTLPAFKDTKGNPIVKKN